MRQFTTRYELLKDAKDNTRLDINFYDPNNIEAELFEDVNLFTGEPIYLVEYTVYSERRSIALKAFYEYPQTPEGRERAEKIMNRVLGGK